MKRIWLCLLPLLFVATLQAEPGRNVPTIRSLQFRKVPAVPEKEIIRMLRAKGIGLYPEAPLDREQLDEARLIISELIEAHGRRGYHVVTTVKDAGNRKVEVIFTAVKK